MENDIPEYMKNFIQEVCPSAPKMYFSLFSEETSLTDATHLIQTLRQKIKSFEEGKTVPVARAKYIEYVEQETTVRDLEREVEKEKIRASAYKTASIMLDDKYKKASEVIEGALRIQSLWGPPKYYTDNPPDQHIEEWKVLATMVADFKEVVSHREPKRVSPDNYKDIKIMCKDCGENFFSDDGNVRHVCKIECPECKGKGGFNQDPWPDGTQVDNYHTCDACDGTGKRDADS